MQIQQINNALTRTVVAPIVDAASNLILPAAAQRANKLFAFDSNGNPSAVTTAPAGLISAAMQPVVNAATLAAGRTAFGLGALATEGIGAGLQDDGSNKARVTLPTVGVSSNQAIAASAHLNEYVVGATSTFSLAKATTLWNGFSFIVFAVGGDCVLAPSVSDSVQGGTSGTSFTIKQGGQAWVVTDGVSAWKVIYVPPTTTLSQSILAASTAASMRSLLGAFGGMAIQATGTTGTWTRSSGALFALVFLTGGGAGGSVGSSNSGGGGAGATTIALINVASLPTIGVTIGAGGVAGNPGGASSFNSGTITAPGGANGAGSTAGLGGAAGTGGLTLPGGDGQQGGGGGNLPRGSGGASFWGGGGMDSTAARVFGAGGGGNTGSGAGGLLFTIELTV